MRNNLYSPFSSIRRASATVVMLACLVCLCVTAKADVPASRIFSFSDLLALYDDEELEPALEQRLRSLLTGPFVKNRFGSCHSVKLGRSPQLGEFLRVVHWNVERGINLDPLIAAFRGKEVFIEAIDEKRFPIGSRKRKEVLEQSDLLKGADIIVINEADWGVKRSEYRNTVAELADALEMNYVFGVTFIELSPIHVSRRVRPSGDEDGEIFDMIGVDPVRYLGFHGLAILSRLPLENVRLVPFKDQPYDWFIAEKKGPSFLEKSKRGIARTVFQEEIFREVRRGGRATLYAEIADDRFPSGRVTIVATHLENRTGPSGRLGQFREMLSDIEEIPHPIILAGDLNTSTSDLTPTSLRRELTLRFGRPEFWIRSGIAKFFGVGMVEEIVLSGATFGRKHADPTVRSIPILAPNRERRLFESLKEFRFRDGGAFDLRGDRGRSVGRKRGRFANSNQRGRKGFVTTYQVKRPIMFIGKYKLDWIFVKPGGLTAPFDRQQSYRFSPHFGRTLTLINEAIPGRISDHRPMMVDIPLDEPSLLR